jgi:hypothetical protein
MKAKFVHVTRHHQAIYEKLCDQGGPAARHRWPTSAPGLSLGRPGRRAAAHPPNRCRSLPLFRRAGRYLRSAVFLAARSSRSRPPRLGRTLRSRRMRSAPPTLDPLPTRSGSAPIEQDGRRPGPRAAFLFIDPSNRYDLQRPPQPAAMFPKTRAISRRHAEP